MKKIAIVHYSGPPFIAGVEMMMKKQANFLSAHHYNVSLLVGFGESFSPTIPVEVIPEMYGRNDLVTQVRQELERGVVSQSFEQLEELLYQKIKAYLLKEEIDISIVHNILGMHVNLALTAAIIRLAKDLPKHRFINWWHDSSLAEIQQGYTIYQHLHGQSFLNQYPWSLIGHLQDHIQYVAISDFRKKELLALTGASAESITVIPNGIEVDEFLFSDPQMAEFYRENRLEESDLLLITPTRAVKKKNLELGIRIMKEIVAKLPTAKLIITGSFTLQIKESGEYFAEMQELVASLGLEKNVLFLNNYQLRSGETFDIGALRIRDLYLLADGLLLPSKIEGFGLPIIEAALCNLPVFCSQIPAFAEVGGKNVNFFQLTDSPEVIATRIIEHLSGLPTYALKKKVRQSFDLETIYNRELLPLIEGKS